MTLLPFALFRERNAPYQLGMTPFKIMYGLPPPLVPSLQTELNLPPEEVDLGSLKTLTQVQKDIWPQLRALYSSSSPPEPHSFEPGDWVLIQRHQCKSLKPWWKGPYLVILTTPMALKVDGISTWIHHTHT